MVSRPEGWGPEPIPLTLHCLELLFGEKESYLPTKALQEKKKASHSLKEGHGGLGQQLQLPGRGNNSEGQRTGKGKSRKGVGI